MRKLLFGLALLATVDLSAQTHPCDLAQPTTFAVKRDQPIRVGFCHSQREDDGVTQIALGAIRFRLVNAANSALIEDLGLLAPSTGPNAQGLYYFQSPTARLYTVDTNVMVTADYLGIVVPSTPILIDVRGGPKPAVNLRAVP